MKIVKICGKPAKAMRICLGLLVLPFIFGFGYPDSTGTQVKVSGGGGSYRFSPGCSRYNYSSRFQEAEVAVQHRIAIKSPDGAGTARSILTPSHISFEVKGDMINKQNKIIGYDSITDDFGLRRGPGPNDPQIGDQSSDIGFAAGAKIGLDWRWVGALAGGAWVDYGDRPEKNRDWNNRPQFLPILGLRLGDADLAYVSGEILTASPIASGGGAINMGVGGKLGATSLWGGYGSLPYNEGMAIMKVSQPLGPVNVSFTGDVGVEKLPKVKEYGFALGVGFRLPY